MHAIKIIKLFSFLVFMSAIFPTIATAQPQEIGAHASAPKFTPVGGFKINKTALADIRGFSGIQLPCVATATYDNGYVLRLSGGGQKILAMAIDFRQSAFVQGRKYPASIRVGQTDAVISVSAVAFSESTLLFNLRSTPSFYQQIFNSPFFELDVDGNTMIFGVGDIRPSFAQLEQCYNPSAVPVPVGGPLSEPPVPELRAKGESMGQPMGVQPDMKWGDKVAPAPVEPVRRLSTKPAPVLRTPSSRLPEPIAPMASPSQQWEAKAGDDLRATLMGWAQRAGVNLDWQADDSGQVVSDISMNGSFEEAVQTLMAQNSAALGVEANMMGVAPTRSVVAPQSIISRPYESSRPTMSSSRYLNRPVSVSPRISSRASVVAPMAPPSPVIASSSKAYSVAAGSSLQAALKSWSKRAGVSFVWHSHEDFPVKRSVNSSSYEAAIQDVLGQYEGDRFRPAAQLNNDPQTSERMLSVESTRVR